MTQIVLPDSAVSQLSGLAGPASVCDSAGHVLGTFIPGVEHNADEYARNPSPLTSEQRERRRQEVGGKTLAEFGPELMKK